ncbi:MAG: nucleotidyltransferase family protein [Candidatus Eisenbacteria bacterium]|nr:nucleotidyltransferase family protein [Candidatus Eisenbacteria bacterium]
MTVTDLCFDHDRLNELCRRYHVARLEVFGSFARGDARPESDVDVLVTLEPGVGIGLEFVALKQELEGLFGRRVDLLTRASVERSANKYFRRFALQQIRPLYEQT